jgi:transcriptional regulator of acetoin/glycerol metabolism
MIERALRDHGGNITAAAAELGISRPTLYSLMQKFAVERKK